MVGSLENGSNNGDVTNIIDIVSLFSYLKNKHPNVIKYELKDVIKEMREVQIEEGTESDTDTQDEEN